MLTRSRSRPAPGKRSCITAALACSIALVPGIGAHVAVADVVNIDVRNNFFQVISAVPGQGTNQCTINAGDTVRWTWFGNFHSVTADDGSYDSGVHNTGFVFSHTFDSSGTYGYHCIINGAPGMGMFGTITAIAPCLSDITGDNVVNAADLLAVINNWGLCAGCAADITGDGNVNVADLLAVINAWGKCP